MIYRKSNYQKHGWDVILLRVFLFLISLSVVVSENGIPISLDLVGQSEFYLSEKNPFILADNSIGAIKFDGSLGYPFGSYRIISFPEHNLPDSINTISFLNWKQGDYDYREIDIGAKSGSLIDGQLSFNGFGRSFPGMYGNLGDGNVLQNYFLNYKKITDNSIMEIGSFYHLENTGLPLSADVIDRYSESFQNGILYEQNSDSYQFKITSSFQSGIMNLGEESYEHFTFWNFTSINYNLSNNFNLFWEFNSKNSSIENDSTKDYSFRILQFGGKWNRSSYFLTMKLGIDEANNLVPLLNLGYLGKYINFKLSRELEGYTEIDDTTSRNNYIRNSISMKLNYHKFSFDSDFSYLVWNNQLIPMVSSNLSYLEDNVKFEFSGYLVQSDDVPIDKYFRTSISVSPQSEFRLFKYLEKLPIIGLLSTAPSKRFRTFAEIDGSYYHYQGNNILDFTSFHGITNQENSTAGFASQLNIAFGFQTSKFKFSYKIQNILNSQNVMFDTMQPLTMFSFLEVEWLFEN